MLQSKQTTTRDPAVGSSDPVDPGRWTYVRPYGSRHFLATGGEQDFVSTPTAENEPLCLEWRRQRADNGGR